MRRHDRVAYPCFVYIGRSFSAPGSVDVSERCLRRLAWRKIKMRRAQSNDQSDDAMVEVATYLTTYVAPAVSPRTELGTEPSSWC